MDFPGKLCIRLISKKESAPISNIAMTIKLYADRKNDYILLLPNSDTNGVICIDRKFIKDGIEFEGSTTIMDYQSNLEHCKWIISLSVLSMEQVFSYYKSGFNYKRRILFPMQYRDLELAENFKVFPEIIEVNISENEKEQNIVFQLKEKDANEYEKEMKQLKEDYLFTVAGFGTLEEFKRIFSKGYINKKNRFGMSLLHSAIAGQNVDIALYLLDEGIDFNMTDEYGRTALHYMAFYPSIVIASDLLKKGANINQKDIYGQNAFQYMVFPQRKNHELISLMADYNPEITDENYVLSVQKIADMENNQFLKDIIKKIKNNSIG